MWRAVLRNGQRAYSSSIVPSSSHVVAVETDPSLVRIGTIRSEAEAKGLLQPGEFFLHKTSGHRCLVLRSYPNAAKYHFPQQSAHIGMFARIAQHVEAADLQKLSLKMLFLPEDEWTDSMARLLDKIIVDPPVYICINDSQDAPRVAPFFGFGN